MSAMQVPTESHALAHAVARLNRRLRQERQSALSATQLSVLSSVLMLGPATPSQIAACERVSQPSVARTIKGLLHGGYLVKSPHPDDKRQVLVRASPYGQEILREERNRRDHWLEERLSQFSTAERERLQEAAVMILRLAEDDG